VDQSYRLITTILDPGASPADELAGLYSERWEIEGALDELKTHQRGARVVLRSKAPDGVYQEAYGHLATHYAVRHVMHDAALRADLDPDRLSFIASLRAARRTARTQPGFPPPNDQQRAHQQAIAEILTQPLPDRRLRSNPHVIKRKISNWAVKRAEHRNPAKPADKVITILAA
jgi:hypothetical protein